MIFVIFFSLELFFLFYLSRLLTQSLSALFYRITKSKAVTIQLLSFLFLPGVIVHELAHVLVAGILFVPVGNIEFLPQINQGNVKLGSVGIGKTDPIRRSIIGFAPVFVGLSVLFSIAYYSTQAGTVIQYVGIVYVLFVIANTMFSSKKDMEGTVELFTAFGLIALALYVAGVRIDLLVVQKFLSLEVTTFFQKTDMFLLVPIGIDVVVVGITKIITGSFRSRQY